MEQFNAWIIKQYVAATTLLTTEGEEGQGLVEYALIIFLVSIAAVGAMILLSGAINGVFGQVVAAL